MLIQTYQSQEPNAAKKFHDDGDRNNDHNDHGGGVHHVRANDDVVHRDGVHAHANNGNGHGHRDCNKHCIHGDDDVHHVHENDDENHNRDYDVHYVHENVLHDDVFLHFFFDAIIDSILV